ncbi:uncharacterized protein LOC110765712 [Prunus avium]|uniref:Uncharacterized protein LOC110765712 n=1 Tax=Prunus avium TaxID=42229 RepID=A0A6P5TBS1_PRUAV|nr:uncharacterized protein LOC110765712 [Prunus avium]
MDDQRELPDFVRRLLRANNSQDMVIGSELCYYGFKFDNRISQELYEGRLLTSSDPRGAPIDVVFVKVARREDAKKIFQRTAAANDGVVLKPWKYLFSGQKEFRDLPKDAELRTGIWTLCYDRFEHNLKDWTNMVKGNVGYYDKLKLPIKTSDGCRLKKFWRDSIRELIVGVGRIHSKGLYHGGLGLESNYVYIDKCLKVINIEGDLDEYEFDEDREEQKKADITDLLGMLDNWFESILAGGKRSWLECQHFFDFVNRAKRKKKLDYDELVKKVVGHPFLLKADERMRLFDHYETMKSGRTGNKVKFALARSAFDNFKSWNSTSTVNSMDTFMLGVYNHRNSSASRKQQKYIRIKNIKPRVNYTGDVEDLLRYLRNLNHHYHEHGLAAGSMEDVDHGVTTHFRGFLELLYRHLEL